MSITRTPAHYRGDTRRTLKGRDPAWIRRYIARLAIRIRTGDEELERNGEGRLLAPSVDKALSFLEDLSRNEEGDDD